jgi:hypothetical protein
MKKGSTGIPRIVLDFESGNIISALNIKDRGGHLYLEEGECEPFVRGVGRGDLLNVSTNDGVTISGRAASKDIRFNTVTLEFVSMRPTSRVHHD